MAGDDKTVVTTKEALNLLGIRARSLPRLERRAGMLHRSRRNGYTAPEVQHLLKAFKQAVDGRKS